MIAAADIKINLFRQAVSHFVEFDDVQWNFIKKHLKLATYNKKDFFVEAGTVNKYIGYIVSGSARYYHVKEGTDITTYFSIEGEFISSYNSFLTRTPSPNSIELLEKSQVILLSRDSVCELMESQEVGVKVERLFRLIAEYLIGCYEERLNSFITDTPEERYLSLLSKSSTIIQRIPQHYIANFLGITPVSLSRIRRRIMEPSKELHKLFDS
jgi:CRP-like cAMP-binding protein